MFAYDPPERPTDCAARLEVAGGCTTGSISRPGCPNVSFTCSLPYGHSGKHSAARTETYTEKALLVHVEWLESPIPAPVEKEQ